jgi:hypothetical protein
MARDRDPEILLDPPPNVAVEVLAKGHEQAPDYSFVGKHAGLATPADALLLRVVPRDAEPWTGRFEGGYPSPSAVTTVRMGPRPDLLLVVNKGSGYLVPVDDPGAAIELELSPIVGVALSQEDRILLAADFTRLAGFGPEGRRWTAEVSWDGIELDGVRGGLAHGRGWDAPEGRKTEFVVDVRNGRVIRGVTPRPRTAPS